MATTDRPRTLLAWLAALGLAGCGSDDAREASSATDTNAPSAGSGGTPSSVDPMTAAGGTESTLGDDSEEPPPGAYGTRANLLAPNSEMAVAEVAGKLYVLGGYPPSRVVQATVQVYDSATDVWAMGPALPIPTHHPVVVGVAGKLYSLGGQHEGDVNGGRSFELDPNATEWTELMPMPTPRGGGAAAVIDDAIYVVGGRPPAGNAFEAYDISDGMWSTLANLPLAYNQRNHLSAAAIGGKLYVAGGRYDGGFVGSPMTDSLDIYDPSTNSWSSGAPMLRARGGVNGVAALGCFHVWGGEGSNIGEPNNVFPDHDVYDPSTNTWSSLAPLPVPVHGVTGAVFMDGLIYIPGGGTASGGNSGSVIHQVFRVASGCG